MKLFRILFGRREATEDKVDDGIPRPERCADCRTPYGKLHELFCTKELCPFCKCQLIGCDCIHTVLKLTEEESKLVDEYVDDSTEPLKSITERWRVALNEKGRIPLGKDIEIVFGRSEEKA